MSQMNYFRRPILIGNSLKRTTNATVRGSVRRNNADGSYNAPYFPGVTVGQTLLVTTQAGSATVTFSTVVAAGVDYNQALTTLNAGLSGATASDTDGVLTITSTTAGGTGSVSVTGGTAATALGFDVSLGAIKSVGGDIASSPEARVGNTFGTAFPVRGENLSSDMITRGIGRISANTDVLHADLQREEAVLQKVGTIVGSVDGKSVTPTSTLRFFNGYAPAPYLSASSTSREIAPFYCLLDPTTKRLLPNRIVGMVVSPAPGGDPPYTNAANPTDTGKNLFGLNLVKFAATAISAIKYGQLITSTGVGTASAIGDVATIASATNTVPFSNNGTKWIVDAIIDANNITLRPMSKAELNQYGITLTDNQPVLELNNSAVGSLGTISISSGVYSAGVSFVVRPILGVSQSVELWATQPLSSRVAQIGARGVAIQPYSANKTTFRGESDSDIPLLTQRYSASSTGDLFEVLDETGAILTKVTSSGKVITKSSDTTLASFNMTPIASTPSAPANGDLWATTAGVLGARLNGATQAVAFQNAVGPSILSWGADSIAMPVSAACIPAGFFQGSISNANNEDGIVMVSTGRLSNLVITAGTSHSTGTLVISLFKYNATNPGGLQTSLTVNLTNGAVSYPVNVDSTHSVTVAQGDVINLIMTNGGQTGTVRQFHASATFTII